MNRRSFFIVAMLGLLACNKIDDIVRAGAKAGAHTADDVAKAGASHVDDAARKSGKVVEESDRVEQAVDIAAEFALETASNVFESDAPAPTAFVETVKEPKYVSLVTEPDAWARLAGGEGANEAPWIFDVRPQGDGVLVGSETMAFSELAVACWRLGTTCVFVGCVDEMCSITTRSVFEHTMPRPDTRVDAYTKIFVDTRAASTPRAAFVMFAGGSEKREFTVVRAKAK